MHCRNVFSSFQYLINKFLNKDPDIIPEEAPLIILDSKSDMCMSKNGKDNKRTMQIASRMNLVRNIENFRIHKIDWCEGVLLFADVATNNVGDNDLNPRTNSILVRLDN